MSTLKSAKKLEEKNEKILEDRANELKTLEKLIDEDIEEIAKFNGEMNLATASNDADAYLKAKERRRAAEDRKEMHDRRYATLDHEALITKEDYEKYYQSVYKEFHALARQTRAKLGCLAKQMGEITEEFAQAQEYANNVLFKLQNDVYRNADRTVINGNMLFIAGENKQVYDSELIRWGKKAIDDDQYKLFIKETTSEDAKEAE